VRESSPRRWYIDWPPKGTLISSANKSDKDYGSFSAANPTEARPIMGVGATQAKGEQWACALVASMW